MKFGTGICVFAALATLANAGPRVRAAQHASLSLEASSPTSRRGTALWLKSHESKPKCHDRKVVDSNDDKFALCPATCPLYADDRGDEIDCNFECVEATRDACIKVNPKEPIPDRDMGICRACLVDGCLTCDSDGYETCATCQSGYTLVDGKCQGQNTYYWYAAGAFFGSIFIFQCTYMVELFRRPIVNQDGVNEALRARSLAKPRMPKDSKGERPLWPIFTNLTKELVCGVGTQLHFNFMACVIVWALAVALGWALLAYFVDDALFILGTRRAKTARQNCILVAWGFETQHRLMWTKVNFMIVLYIATFLLCIALGAYQLRKFQKVDFANSTHKDFAARIRNLPNLDGSQRVEEELKTRIQNVTGQKVVNVSVCWDFVEHEDELMSFIDCKLSQREAELHPELHPPPAHGAGAPAEPQSWFARKEREMIPLVVEANKVVAKGEATAAAPPPPPPRAGFFGPRGFGIYESLLHRRGVEAPSEEITEVKEVDVEGILKSIKTCPDAYAVFETEAARDAAVEAASGGIEFRGKEITLNASRVEPQSVQWPNCANTDLWFKAKRIGVGVGIIGLGLLLWVVAFYIPYAWFSLTFNYSYGREPGLVAAITFSMVVVAGNLLMYQVCSFTAINARFIYIDDREVCYMLCYCFACVFNVVLDLCCTYQVAYKINVGLRQKTHDGHLLRNVDTFAGRFESYAMQRLLANNLWAYAFPATFLIGFLGEPIGTLYVPYKVVCQVIGSQPNIKGYMAEQLAYTAIVGTEYQLARYSDVLLNVMIAVLIFFFPGGFNIQMFGALGVCHIIIYALDHYKVLRCIKAVEYAGKNVDWCAQWILSIPTALLLACFVFKANCEPGYYCLDDTQTVKYCSLAFFAHMLLHTFCLLYVVPAFGSPAPPDRAETTTYKSVNERLACSWFSTNPIYCLRSQYIYKHNPPCVYFQPGKEHLMHVNAKEGFFFHDDAADAEDYQADLVDHKALASELKAATLPGAEGETKPPPTLEHEDQKKRVKLIQAALK